MAKRSDSSRGTVHTLAQYYSPDPSKPKRPIPEVGLHHLPDLIKRGRARHKLLPKEVGFDMSWQITLIQISTTPYSFTYITRTEAPRRKTSRRPPSFNIRGFHSSPIIRF
ncbi:hypothetical protein Ahy_A01g001958 isoform I [Arachis hypogaea]|uniref:Uncharacterized protein n=1 Tax=Arachis hypogaea TaxID=3818 RepID=A0A445EPT3_ARAHY|nr:hypothetical protein Ahy_A01g001958 isoform I [Arachis hypogaea]